MFLAFSTSSKKNFNFQLFFRTRSTFTRHFKIIIFLIELMLILLIFKYKKKNKKNQNLQKKKVEGPIWRFEQTFTYKYRLKTQKKEGGIIW